MTHAINRWAWDPRHHEHRVVGSTDGRPTLTLCGVDEGKVSQWDDSRVDCGQCLVELRGDATPPTGTQLEMFA